MELLKGLAKGELQVGAGTYVSVMFVDRVIARIVREHPEVRLRLANDNWANLLPLLRRRELDLAVVDVRAITDDQDFLITRLTRRQGYLAVRRGHQLLKGRRHRLFDRRVRRRSHCRRWSGNGFLSNPLMG